MRKTIFYFLMIGCVFSIQKGRAQDISVGIKGGISIPNLTSGGTNNPVNSGYSSTLGPDAALFGEYHFSDRLSVELSAEFSYQGGKKNGKQALPVTPQIASFFPPGQAPPYLYANFDAKAEFHYLLVPVLAKYGFDLDAGGKWRFYVDAGPFVGFLLSAKSITKGSSNVYADAAETTPITSAPVSFDTTTDVKSDLKSTNFGVAANIGLAYQFGPHRIFFEGGGNYGFIPVQKNKADGQNNAGAAVVRLGYAYHFGNKGGKNMKGIQDPKVYR